ncbi:MAG: TVP38/TMEM64 family protein [Clostridia bacterium]|nr:TVP38/TMEM64 family protein [Clostridia bacterium]
MKDFFIRIKDFCKNHKKSILSVLWMILGVVAISIVTLVALMAFNVVYFDDGMKFNLEFFELLKTSAWGAVLFVILQTVLTMLLSVIPGISMAFIILSEAIFPTPWKAFLLSFISVMTSSGVMYVLGRFGGYRLAKKLLGEKDCEQATRLLRNKGTVFFPLMMMFPIFPDDALIMVAGTMQMSLKWFIPSIIIGRGIGIATIVFGVSIIPFDKFTAWWHWAGFIAVCALAIFLVFYIAIKFNKYMEKRQQQFEENNK